jgi:hypothetical protein
MTNWKLIKDFGVTALILTMMVTIMGTGGLWLVMHGNQEFAIAWVGILIQPIIKFLDSYMQKRKEDKNGVGTS